MAVPHESGHDDQQLVRYLLGLLPDDEAERLDEMSVADAEVASRLGVVEHDLVDAYVRGTMPSDSRARFESVYLSSPRRREKVRFAESFLTAVDRAAVPDTHTGHASLGMPAVALPDTSPSGRATPRSMPWWGLAVAAGLVLVAGGGMLFTEMRLRNGLHEARTTSAALERRAQELEQQLNDQRSTNAETVKELERVRASLAGLTERPSAGVPGPVAPASQAATMVALVLPPQTRGGGSIPTMAVPRGAGGVAFELQLEAIDFAQYEVALKDPATGRLVWRSSRLAAKSAGDLPVVSVIVPTGALKPQQYSLELTGHVATGGAKGVGSYAFRIVRR